MTVDPRETYRSINEVRRMNGLDEIPMTEFEKRQRMMDEQPAFKIGDRVFKWTGDYQGPGYVRGISRLASGKLRYLVGHRIEGGSGEFLHVYAAGNLKADDPIGDQP